MYYDRTLAQVARVLLEFGRINFDNVIHFVFPSLIDWEEEGGLIGGVAMVTHSSLPNRYSID